MRVSLLFLAATVGVVNAECLSWCNQCENCAPSSFLLGHNVPVSTLKICAWQTPAMQGTVRRAVTPALLARRWLRVLTARRGATTTRARMATARDALRARNWFSMVASAALTGSNIWSESQPVGLPLPTSPLAPTEKEVSSATTTLPRVERRQKVPSVIFGGGALFESRKWRTQVQHVHVRLERLQDMRRHGWQADLHEPRCVLRGLVGHAMRNRTSDTPPPSRISGHGAFVHLH